MDWDSVSDILSDVNNNFYVSSQSIQDCFCLGGYVEGNRCRTILVKLARTADVSSNLSKCSLNHGTLRNSICIKPDVTRKVRIQQAILLRVYCIVCNVKRNWKKNIEFQNSKLYVNNVLHGCVIGSKYEECNNNMSAITSLLILLIPAVWDMTFQRQVCWCPNILRIL